MPRYPRLDAPNVVHHTVSRCVNKEFRIRSDLDRQEWLARLARSAARTDWRPLAFGIMSNHPHLGALAGSDPPWRLMQPLNSGYAQWLNRTQGRDGPVFYKRYHDEIWERNVAILIAYIHNNVVRAGLVRDPADSSWTSHRAYLGLVPPPPGVDVELGLRLAGFDPSPRGRLAFHEFVLSRVGDPRMSLSDERDLARARADVRTRVPGAVEISGPVREESRDGFSVLVRADAPARLRYAGPAATVIAAVGAYLGLPTDAMSSRTQARNVTRGRRIALLVWSRRFDRRLVEMASALQLSLATASIHVNDGPRDREEAELVDRIAEMVAVRKIS